MLLGLLKKGLKTVVFFTNYMSKPFPFIDYHTNNTLFVLKIV